MGNPLAIEEHYIRRLPQKREGPKKYGRLAKAQQSGNVRKRDSPLNPPLFRNPQIRKAQHHYGPVDSLSTPEVRDIRATDPTELSKISLTSPVF
jgi:hypothetical protein